MLGRFRDRNRLRKGMSSDIVTEIMMLAKNNRFRVLKRGASCEIWPLLPCDVALLLPLALQLKSGPVVGRLPGLLRAHPLLGRAQRLGRSFVLAQHAFVKFLHQ